MAAPVPPPLENNESGTVCWADAVNRTLSMPMGAYPTSSALFSFDLTLPTEFSSRNNKYGQWRTCAFDQFTKFSHLFDRDGEIPSLARLDRLAFMLQNHRELLASIETSKEELGSVMVDDPFQRIH
ncbi:hypothetical protein ColTof3_05504 [Colletotrichum tofieldiae]|nr:hypothetical protein ColTof3_05504 [Colletotrichum tofieldiae]GKT84240.1 hypothetical protein Ct61P_02090 [Colletotrichum tofieldiae]